MRHGVTLVELLVTTVVLGIGLVGVAACFSTAVVAHERANRVAQATALAQSTIDALRSTQALTSSVTPLNDPQFPQGQLAVTTSVYDALLHVQRLTVTVTWKGIGTRQEVVSLDTLVCVHTRHVGG